MNTTIGAKYRGCNAGGWYYSDKVEVLYKYQCASLVYQGSYKGVAMASVGQNIGRKDKHGTPIYTGDIVEFVDSYTNSKRRGVVAYNERYKLFALKLEFRGLVYWFTFDTIENEVIVGNTYENPQIAKTIDKL